MRRSGVSRRELLKRACLAGGGMLTFSGASLPLRDNRALLAQSRTLGAGAFATLHAVCARLIPTDESGSGATEAHAAVYIDRALRGPLAASRRDYTQGLALIDRTARAKFRAPFVRLAAPQQDGVLTDLQHTPFFVLVRTHTLQGTFCDPIYGGNAGFAGWDLLGYPGVRLTVTADEQNLSTPATPRHSSAYDSGMFSTPRIDGD